MLHYGFYFEVLKSVNVCGTSQDKNSKNVIETRKDDAREASRLAKITLILI